MQEDEKNKSGNVTDDNQNQNSVIKGEETEATNADKCIEGPPKEAIFNDNDIAKDQERQEENTNVDNSSEIIFVPAENEPKEELNDTNEKDQEIKKTHKMNSKLKKVLIIIFSVIFTIIVIFMVIACINRFNTKVYNNIYFENHNMSNMTYDQVLNYLVQNKDSYVKDADIEVDQNDKNIYTVKAENVKFELDSNATANCIFGIGRTGNILKDNFIVIKNIFVKKIIQPTFKYDDVSMQDTLKNIDLSLDARYVDDTYSIDEKKNNLVIVKGKSGNTVDLEKAKNEILSLLSQNKSVDYQIAVINQKPSGINIDDVYNNVKRDAKDAYIDKTQNPVKLVEEQVGYDFSKDELQKVLTDPQNQEEGSTITFPLTVSQPKVKLSDITYMLYSDKLSGVTTYFPANQYERSNNLAIALRYLNGVVIMPGDTFSYNKIIGDTTSAKGYLPAATFKGGTVVQELGGGICQTVSTLYDAALISNMQIVERHQHGLPVGYVKPSLDATVYGDVLDLKFKNTRKYPVKIVTSYSKAGSLNVSIYGTKEDTEYDISLSSKVLYTIPYTTTYTYDDTKPSTYSQVVTHGVNGYASEGYITKKLNGVVISTELLSKDVYKPEQEVVNIGTQQDDNTVEQNNYVDVYSN